MTRLAQSAEHVYFADFEVDFQASEVRKRGRRIRLHEKEFQLLAFLLERAGELVTREELRQRLWSADTFVDFDANLNTSINRLRQALGDRAQNPVFIKTAPRRGYRFMAPVVDTDPSVKSLPAFRDGIAPGTEGSLPQETASTSESLKWRYLYRWQAALAALLTVAVILTAAILWLGRHTRVTLPRNGKISLLVLPFENLSGDPSQEYFSDGLTDEMIAQLEGQYPDRLKVFARTTTLQYKGTRKSPKEIARELNADVILEGSVRRSGGRVRVTAQLVQAGQQTSLWANTYEQDTKDILQVQQDVAGEIAKSLALELLPAQHPKSPAVPDIDPAAYDSYLLGLYEGNKRTAKSLDKSIEYFQEAIRKSPGFAPAYAGLANSFVVAAGWRTLPPKEVLPQAREAALRAIALDRTLVDAQTALAVVHYQYDWNWSAAEAEFKQTLQQDPNCANCRKCYAEFLMHSGRLSEAMDEMKRARELDPLSPIVNALIGFITYFQSRDSDAILESQKVLNIAPDFPPAHYFMGLAYERQGNHREAELHFRAAENGSGNSDFAAALAHNYAASGGRNQAKQILATLESASHQRYVSPFSLAQVFVGLGQLDEACVRLNKAYEDHDSGLVFLKIYPDLAPLHGRPCYENLLTKLNFPR